ncbi:MAG: hypothetical protein LBS68_01790 [Puniceicoccales bacterium]|nr:hypothetical protein [Puniceicoccales bacterium]
MDEAYGSIRDSWKDNAENKFLLMLKAVWTTVLIPLKIAVFLGFSAIDTIYCPISISVYLVSRLVGDKKTAAQNAEKSCPWASVERAIIKSLLTSGIIKWWNECQLRYL